MSKRAGMILAFLLLIAQVGAATAATVSAADKSFAVNAAQGGMTEVKASELALKKSSSADVKKFAQQMVADHTKAGKALEKVAAGQGIKLPTALDAKHAAVISKLSGLSGAAFDAAYKAQMLKDHKEAVALFKQEAAGGQNAALKSFAASTLPTLQGHLSHITSLAGK